MCAVASALVCGIGSCPSLASALWGGGARVWQITSGGRRPPAGRPSPERPNVGYAHTKIVLLPSTTDHVGVEYVPADALGPGLDTEPTQGSRHDPAYPAPSP